MNLIGKSTIPTIWSRHILDSAQIEKILPKENDNYITETIITHNKSELKLIKKVVSLT